jgi:hypothetical protein
MKDMLRFNGGIAEKYSEHWAGQAALFPWEQSWPPPERVVLVVGKETGYALIALSRDALPAEVEDVAFVQEFERGDYSTLPPEILDHPHLFRGADYRPAREA